MIVMVLSLCGASTSTFLYGGFVYVCDGPASVYLF